MAAPGWVLAYVDWEQQEFAIAAYLSGDANMIAAYESDDPYIKFAELAGAVPPGATKLSHPVEREKFKTCSLAVQYGMGSDSLAQKLGITAIEASDLLRKHRQAFNVYWLWSDGVLNHALLRLRLNTVFGWNLRVEGDANQRSLRNFPMQANGAEMLRIAATLAIQDRLEISAPVHDAFLLYAPISRLDDHVSRLQQHMSDASALVLGGPRLKTDVKVFRYPERYSDPRGEQMWAVVERLLASRRKR
jgi:DNA polymerase I-like protein with 3'-5' exonuclease and polymerase domains